MSEVILNTDECYPYGEITDARYLKVSVRRMVPFSSPADYQRLKNKIEVLKNLKLDCLVKLTKVLEDESAFHLMYEYVPYKLRFYRCEQEQLIRKHLQDMSEKLQSKRMKVRFEHLNLGIGLYNTVKYYLDIEQIEFCQDDDHALRQLHMSEMNLVMEYLSRMPSSSRTEPTIEFEKETLEGRLTELNSGEAPTPLGKGRLLNYKSMTNLKEAGCHPLEILQKIEDKLELLKRETIKYTPAMRETFKSKEHLRETVKEYWKKQKIDCRKMSGHTIYASMLTKKEQTPQKKQLTEPRDSRTAPQSSKEDPTKQHLMPTSPPSMSSTKAQTKQIMHSRQTPSIIPHKEPLNKKDFVELQKTEFQSFYRSKQTYVHEFLNVLDQDECPLPANDHSPKQIPSPIPTSINVREKSNTIYDNHQNQASNPSKITPQAKRHQPSLKPTEPKSGNRSAQFTSKLEEKTNELKQRMAKAFKSRDQVNQRIRKNSMQTQIGVSR